MSGRQDSSTENLKAIRFSCPVIQAPSCGPVADGMSYEHVAIQQGKGKSQAQRYYSQDIRSPVTNLPLCSVATLSEYQHLRILRRKQLKGAKQRAHAAEMEIHKLERKLRDLDNRPASSLRNPELITVKFDSEQRHNRSSRRDHENSPHRQTSHNHGHHTSGNHHRSLALHRNDRDHRQNHIHRQHSNQNHRSRDLKVAHYPTTRCDTCKRTVLGKGQTIFGKHYHKDCATGTMPSVYSEVTVNKLTQDLLEWCKESTQGYANVRITNWTTSWLDGLALCAMIHHYHPSQIDFGALSPIRKTVNIRLGLTAASQLGVPAMMAPDDFGLDRLAMYSYISALHKKFME